MKSCTSETSLKAAGLTLVAITFLLVGCDKGELKSEENAIKSSVPSDASESEKSTNQIIDAIPNFTLVNLPRQIRLQVPSNWWTLTEEHERAIETSMEALQDLSGVDFGNDPEVNLLTANSMPKSSYASVRVRSASPAILPPSEVRSLTASELKSLDVGAQDELRTLLPHQGGQLLSSDGYRLDTISGKPALIFEYRRSGPKGSVYVRNIQIFSNKQTVTVTISYREFEKSVWKPITDVIYKSIYVGE